MTKERYRKGKMRHIALPDESNNAPILYAVIGTWYESDIIEATVKNCFANGCSKVFIIDNASPDRTCEIAKEAGAIIADIYETKYYDEELRLEKMNIVVHAVSEYEELKNIWWLTLDADEFVCGPSGERIIDFLKDLNSRYMAVGADTIDLYPTDRPHYVSGRHPADYQLMGIKRISDYCHLLHWKHPLFRFDYQTTNFIQSRGLHVPYIKRGISKDIIAPPDSLHLFHVPFRTKEDSFNRLNALCGNRNNIERRSAMDDKYLIAQGAIKRWKSFEQVYNQEWDQVTIPHSQIYGRDVTGITLYPWKTLWPDLKTFPRWYDVESEKKAENIISTCAPNEMRSINSSNEMRSLNVISNS